ncbi:MAG: F0F1 ATP synthase subunit delta [Iphinoe sp. HA4291-MV1]|jgi:F-type H+-transporting ATPase subunit delta|nr:F0F1 ATP synthase subunit delta [Iphinoe sp. HA4291-MV1]
MKSNVAIAEISQPYAEALMSVAQSKNLTDQLGEDVRSLLSLLLESEQLRNFLDNPFVALEDKKGVINRILGDGANAYFRNFLLLLVDRRRILLLEPILQQYLTLLRQLKQIALAEVISAVPLTEDQQQAVKDKVIALTKAREVELDTKIDRELIGGVIIRVGSQVIDASLRGQLRRISLRLNGA